MSKTSIKDKAELIKLKKSGMTYQAIADMYGVSRQCIAQIIDRDKVNARRRTDKYREYAKRYYEAHREENLAAQKRWREKHPNYAKTYYRTHKKDIDNN